MTMIVVIIRNHNGIRQSYQALTPYEQPYDGKPLFWIFKALAELILNNNPTWC